MRKLIAYFSASGVTEKRAEELGRITGADLYRISPEEPYTSKDLDWTDRKSRSSVEMRNPDARPAIAGSYPDINAYTTVYIGFPIWWGAAPRIINTFIEGNDLSGKDIVIFATSGGSALFPAVEDLRKRYPDLDIEAGRLLNGKVTEDII